MKLENCFFALITGLLLAVSSTKAEEEEEKRCKNIVWLGNSYSHPLWENTIRMIQEAADPDECFGETFKSTRGGQRMSNWDDDDRITQIFNARPDWDHVDYLILQDQSQVPGFYGHDIFENSLRGVERLATRFQEFNKKGGSGVELQIVFYQTWGRKDGDTANSYYFPDYVSMQERLIAGYDIYRQAVEDLGVSAIVAPAGQAFEMAYDDAELVQQQTENGYIMTLEEGNYFWKLYRGDGHHPSALGAYLASNVIYATITGKDPREIAPEDDPLRAFYSSVAAVVVHNEHDHINFDINKSPIDRDQQIPDNIPPPQHTTEEQEKPPEYSDVTVQIEFDRYPEETGWSISKSEDEGGEIIEGHNPGEFNLSDHALETLEWTMNLQRNTGHHYVFKIVDSAGDGLVDDKNNGSYTVYETESGKILASGGSFTNEDTAWITVGDHGI